MESWIPIFAVVAGAGLAFLWQWAYRDAREERLNAEIAAARAAEARATQALDAATARGQVKRPPSGKPGARSKV